MNATITNPLNLTIAIIGTFLGLSLGFFLLFNKSAKNKANIYLGILILLINNYFLTGALYRYELLADFPHIIGVQNLGVFLIGPLAYFYVRACTQDGFQLKPILFLHFLPFVIDVLFHLPLLMETGPIKFELYTNLMEKGTLFKSTWLNILTTIHGNIYFMIAASLVFTYRKYLTNTTSSIDKAFHWWLLIFLIILSLPILGLVGFIFTNFQHLLIGITGLCMISFVLAVYIATLVKPELFHAFPHQMPISESSEDKKQRYEGSKLEEVQKEKYIKKLTALMEKEKPFQSPDLTLKELAQQTKIPMQHLSQVINEKLDLNFMDFINSYRVRAAQEMLVDLKLSHFTIVSIAYESGFNSKSTFYAAFKKHTEMTPSTYRKQSAKLA